LALERAVKHLEESIREAKRVAPDEPLAHRFIRELLAAKRILILLEQELREKGDKK